MHSHIGGAGLGHNMMWLTDIMIDHFPMYNKFRTVASILVVAEFTIPLLAILALKEIAANRDEWKARYQKPFFITFGICAVLCLAGMFAPELFGSFLSEQEAAAYGGYLMEAPYATLFAAVQKIRMSMISADSLRSLAFIAAGAVALWLYGNRKINVRGICGTACCDSHCRYVQRQQALSRFGKFRSSPACAGHSVPSYRCRP